MSFEKKIKFYRNIPAFILSFIIVGGLFIIWDAFAAMRGDWSFNPSYVMSFRIYHLPIEEILFFITVPYSSIFLYETAKIYLKNSPFVLQRKIFAYISTLFIVIAFIFIDQYYTATVMIFVSLFFLLVFFTRPGFISESLYWAWIFFTYLPFFIVNYFLTSLPIISYSPQAIWGLRIATIPLEDLFYSFALLSLNLYFYLVAKERWLKRK